MQGKLYLVATPIGNLDDITLRALKVLKEVDVIAAEDTRHTLGLLNHFEIKKPLISYYKEIEKEKSDSIIELLEEGKNVAVVSDAGTPGISDPGEEIVKKCIEKGIDIIPIPGACAFVNALIASGFSTREFIFVGFLSTNRREKVEKLEELKLEKRTIILYEAPHKLKNTLETIKEVLGNRNIVLARELTKVYEEFIRKTVDEVLENIDEYRGEFVILIEGSSIGKKEVELSNLNNMSIEEHYKYYEDQGLDKKEIIKQIAKDRNVPKNDIYQMFL
ncbi:MAG: 16S rRNA (cytidine(1402)-2'-O)-methyltransferase [Clostridia bacterium]|nr:16S rRNA (cytidine(1402)-2'-O)-methyltransferase [Clostridia bacterium]